MTSATKIKELNFNRRLFPFGSDLSAERLKVNGSHGRRSRYLFSQLESIPTSKQVMFPFGIDEKTVILLL
ncbi:hypothetical protein XENTR_v10023840 [Xenopus tropicalis]|nr:hypothetical protein XENTR_v10023840 [Xenopus tropicalis]